MQKNRVLVTGAAGFIGANLCMKLFKKNENIHIIGIDNMNAYYAVNIKKWRLSEIERVVSESSIIGSEWNFIEGNIADKVCVDELFREYSCAMKSHFRKSGNQMSGKWKSSYASLLA